MIEMLVVTCETVKMGFDFTVKMLLSSRSSDS